MAIRIEVDMMNKYFGRLCLLVFSMLGSQIYAHYPNKSGSEGYFISEANFNSEPQSRKSEDAQQANRIDQLQKLSMSLQSSNEDEQTKYLQRINRFANEVESFNEESLQLLRIISDAAYNKNMKLLFIATQGLLIDYDLSMNHLEDAKEKRAFLFNQKVMPSSSDSLNIELELDLISICNLEFDNKKSIELGKKLEGADLSIWQTIKLDILLAQAYVDAGNLSKGIDYYFLALEASKTQLNNKENLNEIIILE